jgi:hypothetical protein
MQPLLPQLGIVLPLLGAVAEDLFDLGADVLLGDVLQAGTDAPDVDDRGEVTEGALEGAGDRAILR